MAAENKKNKKPILIILILLIFIGAGAFGGFYFYLSKNNASAPIIMQEGFVEIGEIFVNLSDEGSKRYVKLNMSVSYDKANEDIASEIEDKKIVIRDVANFYIKSCKAKDFEPANEVVLKGDLISRINQKLTSGLLKDIYISEIIVQ
ncbi:flagellar basal body-associated FliL family protein [Clostridium sp. AL.422]|uniref:flagellar basal body-associated FliL family protein n=1 Tax=Clostridium TaxID=1485 RepID=UPI00293DF5F0|nr:MULTISPECIES: flagellar basal body-associated FliL family protein [unclassified Clostridium]MDV4149694.1 flagellar basal body-associated FliL family protein [Clostridium sp. AL.422]